MRLTLWYAASSFSIVLAATAILYWVLIANLNRQDDQFLMDELHILQDLLTERPDYADAIRQEVEWEAAARRYARVYERLLDASGNVLSETPSMDAQLPKRLFPTPIAVNNISGGCDQLSPNGTPFRIIAATLVHSSPGGVQTIQVAMNRVQHHQLIRNYRWTLFLVTLSAFPVCCLTAFVIAKRGIQWVVECPAGLVVEANRSLLQRALGNLIENALHYTPSGGTIAVCAIPSATSLRIEVADNGAGIPPEDLPHVFDRFYRVEKDRSTSTGGSGLGLAIVRSVVELHGGEVKIESIHNIGTTVVLTLPYSRLSTDNVNDETVICQSSR